MEAARHQRFDPLLGGGSPERTDARIPPGAELDVRRQAGVDEALGLCDRPFVELGDPGRERLYERIEIGVGQRAINVAVGLGLVCCDVFRAQEHLEGAISADESRKPSHGAAAGDHPHAHLPLRYDGFLAASKSHVAGQQDLAAVARRAATDEGDRGDWQAGQTREKVRPLRQSCGPCRQ